MVARVNSVTQARDAQRAHDVGNIALTLKDTTSGEQLRGMNLSWNAGERYGFDEGFERGQKHMAETLEAVQGAL